MIREAIEAYLLDRPESKGSEKLWASDLGQCPRKAILRLLGTEAAPFEVQALEYMNFGLIYEADTVAALKHAYPGRCVRDQPRLEDEYWSGKADAILEFETESFIIEHKAVGDKWWNYKDNLPRPEHVAQLGLYGYLYEKKTGRAPQLILYYRAWGNWAELNLTLLEGQVQVFGRQNGAHYEKRLDLDIPRLRQELEACFDRRHTALPPRLVNKAQGCTFQGRPSCPYYRPCWGG